MATPSASSTSKPSTQEISFLSALELTTFHNAVANYKIHKEFLTEDAIALHWIFGTLMTQVLELIDEDSVSVIKSSTSGKILVQVYGKTGDVYWIPPGKCLCQCIAYERGKREYCKHVLAAHIVLAIQDEEDYETTSETDMLNIYNSYIAKKK